MTKARRSKFLWWPLRRVALTLVYTNATILAFGAVWGAIYATVGICIAFVVGAKWMASLFKEEMRQPEPPLAASPRFSMECCLIRYPAASDAPSMSVERGPNGDYLIGGVLRLRGWQRTMFGEVELLSSAAMPDDDVPDGEIWIEPQRVPWGVEPKGRW